MKITQKHKEAAVELFDSNPSFSELFVNKNGEFFTNQNLAQNSVKGKKSDYARISKVDVATEEELDDSKNVLETVKTVEGAMVVITDNKKELTFPNVKNEVREPIKGDVATVDGEPAEGEFLYQGSTLVFKAGALDKLTYKKDAPRSLFAKFLGK